MKPINTVWKGGRRGRNGNIMEGVNLFEVHIYGVLQCHPLILLTYANPKDYRTIFF
jgi:hypothetical protein